jgi:MFS family permease
LLTAESRPAKARAASWAIWSAATLSGGAGLAYEICWSRALVVPLGNSMDAAALVLAGFMLGIALGAGLGGNWAERVKSPLRLYALLEVLLGLYALVAPLLFETLAAIPAQLGGFHSAAAAVVVRFTAAGLLVVLPSLALGATLPLLVRALTRVGATLRLHISIVYGANTAGAAVGACVTGFWGIAAVGLSLCSGAAAAAGFSAAGLALVVSYGAARPPVTKPAVAADPRPQRDRPALARMALGAAAVSGFAMLGCELLWARVLTFVYGHDTYAFASLLAIVLGGLAVGGLLQRLLARRDQAELLAVLLGLFALAVLVSFWGAAALVVHSGRDPFGLQASGRLAASVWLEPKNGLALVFSVARYGRGDHVAQFFPVFASVSLNSVCTVMFRVTVSTSSLLTLPPPPPQ